ncbi:unnamed protein product [Clonostachys rosea f. rosea IK726]|uniref:Uncharacterized protein n=1 Tax=Clonostachys rosea f. rosea IK726 TaxID=1349383 RepID=A0ACA9U786_BIOOC|nr:unnamed protein product [Clonostachys rosea f. rosea IK726]
MPMATWTELMGTHDRQKVGHIWDGHAEEGVGTMIKPDSSLASGISRNAYQWAAILSFPVDSPEGTCDGIKPGRIDKNIELTQGAIACLDAGGLDCSNGGLLEIHQMDVGLVVHFEVAAL